MRPLLGAILVFACATVAALALLGSSSSASGPPFTPERAPALQLDPRLTAADRAWIASVVASVRPEARRLLVAVSGQVEVQLADADSCPRTRVSCVHAASSGDGRPIVVALQRDHLDQAGTDRGRFLVLHELAHAVDAAMLGAEERETLWSELHAGLGAASCSPPSGADCLPAHELFADEFARWAGGYPASLSTYATPALVDDARFTGLLTVLAEPRSVDELFGAWPD